MKDKKPNEPKKIKMPPLLDRSMEYDTLSFDGYDDLPNSSYKTFWKTHTVEDNEDNSKNNSQSIQQLDSESSD